MTATPTAATARTPNGDKMDAELAQLKATTAKLIAETQRLQSEMPLLVEKLQAETRKLHKEADWYPLVLGAALITAGAALAKLFL